VPYISEIIALRFTSRVIYYRDHGTQVYITCHIFQRSLHTGLHHVPFISEIIAHRFTSRVIFQRSLHTGLHHVPYISGIIALRFTSRAICFRDHCTQVCIMWRASEIIAQVYIKCHMPQGPLNTGVRYVSYAAEIITYSFYFHSFLISHEIWRCEVWGCDSSVAEESGLK